MTLAGEPAAEQISFSRELLRKATHLGALIIPGGYYLLSLERADMLAIMVPVTVGMILIDVARLRQWWFWRRLARPVIRPLIRQHEAAGDFTGASYILLSVCLTVALFVKPIAIAALCFIIVGDVFAAIIGRSVGRHRFGRKTVEGSLGCLAGTLLVALFIPELPWTIKLSGAVIATVVEALPLGVDDNVSVPILAGLGMTLLEKIVASV
ncbi:MAG: hypothetical protein AB1744_09220 [Candidatus Zixiibacteriota bacterium]